jgi:hypothetical protein
VLLVARDRLDLKLPPEAGAWTVSRDTVNRLAEDVLRAGVHGRENVEHSLSGRIPRRAALEPGAAPRGRWRVLVWLLVPPAAGLGPRYGYARANRWLLPLAWFHRLVRTTLLAPAAAWSILRFGFRYLVSGSRRERLQGDLGLRQP